jgi:transposase InsO family protein
VSEVRPEVEQSISDARAAGGQSVRLTALLDALSVPRSSWYRPAVPADEKKPPGPPPKPIPDEVVRWVVQRATENPWYGYKRIAVMCRRAGQRVKNRQAYQVMKQFDLLHRPVCRKAELHQAAKLFELLPRGPNELWQMDVTYVHIPGHGWRYAITVIDYYSRYLLACHLTWSYSAAQAERALSLARQEAERLCGPLSKQPFLVTDNGPTFIARRFGSFLKDAFTHVRIAYRTPTQLGLLERFHRTLKDEELYWRLYDSPEHCRQCLAEFRDRYNGRRPHWALVPESGGDPVTPADVYVGGVRTRIPRWQGWAKAAKAKLDELMQEAA